VKLLPERWNTNCKKNRGRRKKTKNGESRRFSKRLRSSDRQMKAPSIRFGCQITPWAGGRKSGHIGTSFDRQKKPANMESPLLTKMEGIGKRKKGHAEKRGCRNGRRICLGRGKERKRPVLRSLNMGKCHTKWAVHLRVKPQKTSKTETKVKGGTGGGKFSQIKKKGQRNPPSALSSPPQKKDVTGRGGLHVPGYLRQRGNL